MKRLVATIGHSIVIGALTMATLTAALTAQQVPMPKYGVTVSAEKKVDFSKFTSYTWTLGQPSFDKDVDRYVTDAVDRQLGALGMSKAATAPGDVLVAYYSLRRTDVDLRAKPDAQGLHPQYAVGTLMVALLDPGTRKRLLRMRIDKPIEVQREALEPAIQAAVTELFAKYPTRSGK